MAISSRRLGRAWLDLVSWSGLAFILTPLAFVIWLSFFRQEVPSFPPEGYALRWYGAILQNRAFVDGFLLSSAVGVMATAIGLIVGIPASLCLVRFRFVGRDALNSYLLMPLVVPGVVLGTALYVFQVETEIATGLPILGSTAGLVLGHVLIVIPWCVRLVTASLVGFNQTVEEAAMNLGATPLVTFFRVTLPLIRPGIVAAALFGFVMSFSNLEMSLFLIAPGQSTLPIAILQYLEWKIDPVIAAVSVVQILLIGTAMVVTDRYVKLAQVV